MSTIIGLSIALFIFVVLLLKRHKKRYDFILTAWLGYIALHIFLYHLHATEHVFEYPFLIGTVLPLPLLHSVFLYFYTKELIAQSAFTHRNWWWHLLPFLVFFLLLVPFLGLPSGKKADVFRNDGTGYEWYITAQLITFLITGLFYNLLSFRLVRKYKKEVLNYISNKDRQMLKWLEGLIIGLSLIWIIAAFTQGDNWIFIAVAVFVCFIGIYGFRQVPVYFIQVAAEPEEIELKNTAQTAKYHKSGLDSQQAVSLFAKLEDSMQRDHLYLKNDLTLAEVARHLGEPVNRLSQAINSQTGSSFYNYINRYRVSAFLERVKQPKYQHFTHLALAMDCGFNSKSTFNKYFKLSTGKTPTAYLKQK